MFMTSEHVSVDVDRPYKANIIDHYIGRIGLV